MPVRGGVTTFRDQKASLASWYANGAPGEAPSQCTDAAVPGVHLFLLPARSSFAGQVAASACAGVGAKTSPAVLDGKPLVAGRARVPGCRARTFRCPYLLSTTNGSA